MPLTRRSVLGAVTAAAITPVRRGHAQMRPMIRIGVINDQSGPYRDVNGPTSIACTKQAIQEFAAGGFEVEVLTADHQNKPGIGTAITRQWIDQEGVDFIQDGASSAVALAITAICREKNKVFVPTSTATSDLTGKACTPNTIRSVYDTYMEAKSTGGAMVKAGGDTWYFITPNYAAGLAFQRDTTNSSRMPAARSSAATSIRSRRPPTFPRHWWRRRRLVRRSLALPARAPT
jgi:branched-chain amino acid transport system substrate-binding protein